jgi:hypothetical protein
MSVLHVVKAAFMGFGLCVGVQILVFFIAGAYLKISRRNFVRVFVPAAVASFAAVDLLLYIKIICVRIPEPMSFLSGTVGGWLAGVFFGLSLFKSNLTRLLTRT